MVSSVKRRFHLIVINIVNPTPLLAIPSVFAASATMSLSPSSGTYTTGNNFAIKVYENSGTEPVNAVEASISYPASLVDYVSVTNSSAFSVLASTSGGSGTVDIQRGALPAVTGNQLVATITF